MVGVVSDTYTFMSLLKTFVAARAARRTVSQLTYMQSVMTHTVRSTEEQSNSFYGLSTKNNSLAVLDYFKYKLKVFKCKSWITPHGL
jgi:hypothetical protein